MKLCDCGCGLEAPIAKLTNRRYGHIAGQPTRFIQHHGTTGAHHHAWNNGRSTNAHGYVRIKMPDHVRADKKGYVMEHIVIAEKALGRSLPDGVQVHHANRATGDNRNHNLVICEDSAYHHLLHQRLSAFLAGCPVTWLKCPYCKKFDAPANLWIAPDGRGKHHRECVNAKHRSYDLNGRLGVADVIG